VGSQAGSRVGPRSPAESGSGMGAQPDQGDVIVESGPSESGRGRRDPACTEGCDVKWSKVGGEMTSGPGAVV
jgi:hypothetical protein